MCVLIESEDEKRLNGTNEKSEEKDHIKSGSEDDEQEGNKSREKTSRKSEQQINSEDSSDEEGDESEKESNQTNCDDSPNKMLKNKTDTAKKGETSDSDSDNSSDKVDKGSDSSDNSDEGDDLNFVPFTHTIMFAYIVCIFITYNDYKKKPEWKRKIKTHQLFCLWRTKRLEKQKIRKLRKNRKKRRTLKAKR